MDVVHRARWTAEPISNEATERLFSIAVAPAEMASGGFLVAATGAAARSQFTQKLNEGALVAEATKDKKAN
jgi:hypothetical protein